MSFRLTIFLLSFCIIPVRAQTHQELCDMAVEAVARDSLGQAAGYLLLAIAAEPDNPRNPLLYAKLGDIQRRQGRLADALDSYDIALRSAPLASGILMSRASLNMELERWDAALDDYTRVLDLERDNERALLMRAFLYMRRHDYRRARIDFRRLLSLDPFSYSGRLGLATLNRKDGRPEEALDMLSKMIDVPLKDSGETPTERAALYVVRAGVEMDLQLVDAALLDLETALNLDPTQAEAYLIRGQIHLSRKAKAKAREDFERAIACGIPHEDMVGLLKECKE